MVTSSISYNRFRHIFVDRQDQAFLVSLKIGDADFGKLNRFLEPIFSPDHSLAFTHELKWVPALSQAAAVTGWNERPVLIDLKKGRFQTGSWRKMTQGSLKLKANWQKLGFFWKDLSKFESPLIERKWNGIENVTDEDFAFRYWDEVITIRWAEIQKIHFSKRAVNTLEVPDIEAEIQTGDGNHRLHLPDDPDHVFFQKIFSKGISPSLTPEVLQEFLNAEQDAELSVLSKLGMVRLPLDRGIDLSKAEQGIELQAVTDPAPEPSFLKWTDIPLEGHGPILNARVGGLYFEKLEPAPQSDLPARFPAQRFYFRFSKLNEAENQQEIKDFVRRWTSDVKLAKHQFQFHADDYQFFVFKSAVFEMEFSYGDSAGSGSLVLAAEFYRKMLLELPQFQTSFASVEPWTSKASAINVDSGYFPAEQIFPTPSPLHLPGLHFWKSKSGEAAMSFEGFLYQWRQGDLQDVVNEIADEYGDRGGPYMETILQFKNDSFLRLRMESEMDTTSLKVFLISE